MLIWRNESSVVDTHWKDGKSTWSLCNSATTRQRLKRCAFVPGQVVATQTLMNWTFLQKSQHSEPGIYENCSLKAPRSEQVWAKVWTWRGFATARKGQFFLNIMLGNKCSWSSTWATWDAHMPYRCAWVQVPPPSLRPLLAHTSGSRRPGPSTWVPADPGETRVEFCWNLGEVKQQTEELSVFFCCSAFQISKTLIISRNNKIHAYFLSLIYTKHKLHVFHRYSFKGIMTLPVHPLPPSLLPSLSPFPHVFL